MGELSSLADYTGSLPDHDRSVLQLLAGERDAEVTFQGIRRRLGVHQESLVRALRRLQEDELVERTEEGYRVSAQGLAIAQIQDGNAYPPPIPILRTVLPGREASRLAVEALRGRWFGDLRWYAQSFEGSVVTLSWVGTDGSMRIDARFDGIFFSVNGQLPDASQLPQAVAAAHRLLYLASQAYVGAGRSALPGSDT